MGFEIRFDGDSMQRKIDAEVKKNASDIEGRLQDSCDDVYASHAGKDETQVREALLQAFRAHGISWDFGDPSKEGLISKAAAGIASGDRPVIRLET